MAFAAILVTAMVLASDPTQASDAAESQELIAQPRWLSRPDGQELATHFPQLAQLLGIEGRATLVCKVDQLGALKDCAVTEESPRDMGFGVGALQMASEFRMQLVAGDGKPVAGRRVRVPFRFGPPPGQPRAAPSAKPSAPILSSASLALGRRLADITGRVEAVTDEYDRMALRIEGGTLGEIPMSTGLLVAATYRQVVRSHGDEVRDAYARAYARVFEQKELAAIVAFESSAGGELLRATSRDPEAATILARRFNRNVMDNARQGFCKTWDCVLPGRSLAARGTTDDHPHWVREPTDLQIFEAARLNSAMGLTGSVELRCNATDAGSLTDCEVSSETPADLGYGAAALSLAMLYRVPPAVSSKGPATVSVRIDFKPRELPQGPPVPVRRSESALALARLLANGDGSGPVFQQRMLEVYQRVIANQAPPVSPTASEKLRAAFAAAVVKATDSWIEDRASLIAAKLSEEQLSQVVAFTRTPAGFDWWHRGTRIAEAVDVEMRPVRSRIGDEVRAAFCRDHACLK